MQDKKSFGEFILQKRKEQNLTQKDFAESLFITESAVSKWERGISYPDITLIRKICDILKVNEHELFVAGEDKGAKIREQQAKNFRGIIWSLKLAFSLIYGITLVSCFIVNLAVEHTLSWFFIVLFSICVSGSLTFVPLFMKKFKALSALVSFVFSIGVLLWYLNYISKGDWFFVSYAPIIMGLSIIFLPILLKRFLPKAINNHTAIISFFAETILLFGLLAIINNYVGGDWLVSIALPITLLSILPVFAWVIVIRYIRINAFFKTSLCTAIAVVFHYFANGAIARILDTEPNFFGYKPNFSDWSYDMINQNINSIIQISLTVLFIIFGVVGIAHQLKQKIL